jgi:hypothetical protein
MKRKLAAMVMAAMATAAVAAGPASANDRHGWNDRNDDDFFGYPYVALVDDVEYENVRERNDRDGECRVADLDLDGFIAEYELVCYY